MSYEVEMKFALPKYSSVRDKLIKLRAENLGKVEMVDLYFDDSDSTMKSTDRAIRIRKEGDKIEITYKGPNLEQEAKTRTEINVKINDLEAMTHILEALGYSVSGSVKKVRERWRYEEYDIALDDVEDLGNFLEIEALVEDKEMIPARINELKAFAIQIGVDPKSHILKSYVHLLEEAKNGSVPV